MFSVSDDPLPPQGIPRLAKNVLIALTTFALAFIVLMVSRSEPARGRLADLSANDAEVLNSIRGDGILVRDAGLPCTFKPHLVVDIRWSSSHDAFCVHAIGLRSVGPESIADYVPRFDCLSAIDMRFRPESDRRWLSKRFPTLAFDAKL